MRKRRAGVRVTRVAMAAGGICVLAACGAPLPGDWRPTDAERSTSLAGPSTAEPEVHRLVAYSDWCRDSGIQCPDATAPDFPGKERPWGPREWAAVSDVFQVVAASQSRLAFSADDFGAPDLAEFMAAVGRPELLDGIRAELVAVSFRAAGVGAGSGRVDFDRESAIRRDNGLELSFAGTLTAATKSVTAGGGFAVSGLAVGGSAGASVAVLGVGLSSPNVFDLRLADDRTVTGIPLVGAIRDALGTELAALIFGDGGKTLPPAALPPLIRWLTASGRTLRLGAPEAATLARALPALAGTATDPGVAGALLAGMTELTTGDGAAGKPLVRGVRSGLISCQLGDQVILHFDREFGVKRVAGAGSDGAGIELFGIQAERARGLVRPRFRLAALTWRPGKLVVHDVPVVGAYTIDLNDPDLATQTVICH